MLEYKGYLGKVELDAEAGLIHGEVINTRDVITFQGDSVVAVQTAFRQSVDDYLEFCQSRGETPDKPFSGQFVTRIPPDLHRQVNAAALIAGKSLNAWVAEQLQGAVLQIGALRTAAGKKPGTKAASSKRKPATPNDVLGKAKGRATRLRPS
jgi:predicted HicB family RNase H-like nuclease